MVIFLFFFPLNSIPVNYKFGPCGYLVVTVLVPEEIDLKIWALFWLPEMLIKSACNIKWLGLRKDDLDLIPQQSFFRLTPKDMQIAKSLTSLEILQVHFFNSW